MTFYDSLFVCFGYNNFGLHEFQTTNKQFSSCSLSGPFDVSFESEGMHGWKLCESYKEKSRPNWYFSMGITGSPFTGPVRDHTTGSGTSQDFKYESVLSMARL